MTEKQKLRYELLKTHKNNIVEAKLAYNFIIGKDKPRGRVMSFLKKILR